MSDLVWRLVERRLRRTLPPDHVASTIGDLAEDYERRRTGAGPLRARLWLLAEGRSLTAAYRLAGHTRRPVLVGGDLRRAWRRIAARPGAAAMCASLLAVGIGLSTAMFSVVDALLLRPAPFPHADRLVWMGLPSSGIRLIDTWRATGLVEVVEAAGSTSLAFEGRVWPAARITPGAFDMLGVRPVLGRGFQATKAMAGPDEVLLSEAIWRATFGGDPAVLGRRLRFDDGTSAVVVGIMPVAFRFPEPTTIAWTPLDMNVPDRPLIKLFGRLEPGVPFEAAETRLGTLALQLPELGRRRSALPLNLVAEPASGTFTREALTLLLAAAALVFVVLCANVSALLLAGLSARRRALGASRARLIREVAAEHAFIGIAGFAAGVGLAWSLTSVVPAVFLGRTLNPIDLDPRALLAASGLGVASVLLAGLIPAWLGTRTDAVTSLRATRQAGTETRAARLATRGLLVAQTALACSLLVGSGLLIRSFANLVRDDRGLDGGVVRVRVSGFEETLAPTDSKATARQAVAVATTSLEQRFTAWPRISAVALSREIPPESAFDGLAHLGPPGAPFDAAAAIRTDEYRVGPSFFNVYGIPIVRGRTFQPGDTDRDVIVSERLAARLWPNADPLGRTFAFGSLKGAQHVVGVTRDIRLPALDSDLDRPELYRPLGIERTVHLSFRCQSSCPAEVEVQAQVHAVHPALTVREAPPSEDAYARHLVLPRATTKVAGVFAAIAVLTAAGGLFSVLTGVVGRRRREFGIRAALGAAPAEMRRLVLRDGLSIVAIGAALGTIGGWTVGRSLEAFQYGVTASDPVTWTSVIGTVALVSLAAAWRPALQAMRVDPVKLLREE